MKYLVLTLILTVMLLHLPPGSAQEDHNIVYNLEIEYTDSRCDSEFVYSEQVLVDGEVEGLPWQGNVTFNPAFGNLTTLGIDVDEEGFLQEYPDVFFYDIKTLLSCFDHMELIELISKSLVVKGTESFHKEYLMSGLGFIEAFERYGMTSDPLLLDIFIDSGATLASDPDGLRSYSTQRLNGQLTSGYELEGQPVETDLEVDLFRHLDYSDEHLLGYWLEGDLIGQQGDSQLDESFRLHLLEEGREFAEIREPSPVVRAFEYLRIATATYPTIVISVVTLIVSTPVYLIMRYRRRRRERPDLYG